VTAIAVIYDGSALLAYAHGQIAAAELISEINAEGRQVGVPSTCLAAAVAELTDEWDITQLMRLVNTKTMVILPLGADDLDTDLAKALREVGEYARLAQGDLAVAHAVATALTYQAYYVTANPRRAAVALPPSWPVLDLTPVRLVSDRFGLVAAPTTAEQPVESEEPAGEHAGDQDSKPMPTQLKPMLAVQGQLPVTGGWGYEFDWAGARALCYVSDDDFRLVGRNSQDITRTWPELGTLRTLLHGHRAVLDGEIVVLGRNGVPSAAALEQRTRSRLTGTRAAVAAPVRLYLFDLLYLDGVDMTPLPYTERRDALQRLDLTGDTVDTPSYWAGDSGPALVTAAQELGLAGVIAKRLASPYQPGRRSPAWVRFPVVHTAQVIVAGYKAGGGRRAETVGSVLLGMYDGQDRLRYVGQVSTGFTETALRELRQRLDPLRQPTAAFDQPLPPQQARGAQWVRPVLVADVTYRSWTPDGRLRHPVWKGLRNDRDPAQVRL
jgi:bifunctional non-homologous end joining protein LigD